jgi:hypothetical protein
MVSVVDPCGRILGFLDNAGQSNYQITKYSQVSEVISLDVAAMLIMLQGMGEGGETSFLEDWERCRT